MMLPFPVLSLSLLPTRSTLSRRSSRLPMSTTPPTPPTLHRLLGPQSTPQFTQLSRSLSELPGLFTRLDMLLLLPLLSLLAMESLEPDMVSLESLVPDMVSLESLESLAPDMVSPLSLLPPLPSTRLIMDIHQNHNG